ncbi:metal-dependent hydrolase [Bacillus sp. FJAT-50079]|uniref:metal-dependent hydrolase n=1 Tax=Bacillus sp. FJAT-50079 TaxID=2833577 RepID=UPI001BCA6086|nr:metal-dependent hydrolase [Bacillus sp. FJAT-50079]MBS4209932.1 metal-dependent hydrolase [Bacillus sp. FJAT-50079]
MDGKTHFIIGGVTGIGIAKWMGVDLPTTVSLSLLGGCVGLVPDLDVKGTLSRKISLNKKWLTLLAGIIGLLFIISNFSVNPSTSQWLGICVGIALLTLPPIIIKQKMMVLLTGIAVGILGIWLQSKSLIMLGAYIGTASRLPHRSLTHSLIGLAYFSGVGYFLEQELRIDGIMLVCMFSYASHLLLDMKWIPKNRRGVKLFQPFLKWEF